MKNIALLIIVLLLISCAGHDHYEPRRGSLKEGMEKTSDDYEGERKVKTTYEFDHEPDVVIIHTDPYDHEDEYEEDDEEVIFSDAFKKLWISTKFSSGLMKSEHFYGFHQFNLGIGGYISEKNWLNTVAGYSYSPVQETSELHSSIDGGVHLLNIGVEWKLFTTPEYTFMGNYFLFGTGLDFMGWSYKNAVLAYDDFGNEEWIDSDLLQGYEFYTGVGFNLLNPYNVQFGLELSPGVILWHWRTSEGFDNDLFDPFLYLKLKAVINFGF